MKNQLYTWEVIVVDDGSTDRTAELVKDFEAEAARVSLLSQPHRGKGHAVRAGVLAARGKFRFQCDADLSMPIEQLSRFLPPKLDGYQVAVGSREVLGSRRIGEPTLRHLMGRVFNLMVHLTGVGLSDTQCGFKCFAGPEAHGLFPLQRLDGFGSDVEVLYLAKAAKLKVIEVPIDWYYRSGSKVRPVRDTLRMLRDLAAIKLNRLLGRYRMRN